VRRCKFKPRGKDSLILRPDVFSSAACSAIKPAQVFASL